MKGKPLATVTCALSGHPGYPSESPFTSWLNLLDPT